MKTTICFFDDYFLATRQGTIRRYFKPQFLGYLDDKNYKIQTYTSFFYDEKIKKFRAYYEVESKDYNDLEIRTLMLALASSPKDFTTGNFTTHKVMGWKGCVHGSGVAYNPDEDLFVMVSNCNTENFHARPGESLLSVGTSRDGVNFDFLGNIHTDYSDTLNSICYNPYTKEYIVTMRACWGDRRICVIRSSDLINWTKPEMILYPTASENNYGAQHYALGISHCNGTFYGVLWRYITDLNKTDYTDMAGIMENDLYYSYNGVHYYPTGLSPVCVRPLAPAYGSKQMWLQNVCDDNEGKFVLFGSASKIAHGEDMDDGKMINSVLYEIRKDGFCALEGTTPSATVYTKNFALYGDKISINCNCLGGTLRYAVTDENGNCYDGFSFDDCTPIAYEDCVDRELSWAKPTSTLKNKKIRLAFKLFGCLIHSITFDGALWTMWPQKNFCDTTKKD